MEVFVQNSSLKDSPIVQHYPDVDQAQCGRCAVITRPSLAPPPSLTSAPHSAPQPGTQCRLQPSQQVAPRGRTPCKFHDNLLFQRLLFANHGMKIFNNTRPAAPQQPVPAVVMTECGGVMIELICRKIFLWQTNKLYKHSSPHQSPVTTGYRPTQSIRKYKYNLNKHSTITQLSHQPTTITYNYN